MNLVLLQPALRAFETKHNLDAIETLVRSAAGSMHADDILLLPEHFTFGDNIGEYEAYIRNLACMAGCTVVGGSHHANENGKRINRGSIMDGEGNLLGTYAKVRPYFDEVKHVVAGDGVGEFTINGRNILVLICADFWYADIILGVKTIPDLVLVPSLSVSRKPTAEYARNLWRHLAISRSYEFGAFIGISDWSEASMLPKNRTSGVGGLADPTQLDPAQFFRPVGENGVTIYPLDFDALHAFREDRRMRGFFWK